MIYAQGQKIIVGDSDRTVLEMLQIRLDTAGYHVCLARNGPAVLEVLKQVRPAVMILDAGLAELSAFDILDTMKKRGEKPCPVLLIGRRLAPEDVKRGIGLGVRDCMLKPFSGSDVVERVARLLRPPVAAKPAPTPAPASMLKPPPPEFGSAYV